MALRGHLQWKVGGALRCGLEWVTSSGRWEGLYVIVLSKEWSWTVGRHMGS